ncbi:MAG: DsbA family oxidoreductase [Aquabacterium sp.]
MTPIRIDFVSDVACPWCAVGLNALEAALDKLDGEVAVEIAFQPYELNPDMPAEGADTVQYLGAKYGIDAAQIARNQAAIRERGAEVGFTFGTRSRVWNTFDAHRLLHWAGLQSPAAQRALKHGLLKAYHGEGRNPGAADVLVAVASAVGLDAQAARAVLDSGQFTDEVRAAEQRWHQAGISAVPSVVINDEYLIQGGQPADTFERALRQIASEMVGGPGAAA